MRWLKHVKYQYGPVQADEIDKATTYIIKVIQKYYFGEEIQSIQKLCTIKPKSNLMRLNLFLDEKSVLRIGGRLRKTVNLSPLQRHPVILPAKCEFTKLVFVNEHLKLIHGGPQSMLASIRLKYWPLNGRDIARQVARSCVPCFKCTLIVVQPIMVDLPAERLEPSRAFLKTGIDFAGPFFVKSSQRRKDPVNKAYSCIFVCFAVHIELASGLTMPAFINALQRFCDRRGLCSDIFCDNATNFIGGRRQLDELHSLFMSNEHQEQVINHLSNVSIQWHFIPPRSPHFGGLCEAAVRSL
ncbi:uncharacterized protein LOC126909712 [Daktulosphaira vitifoliae]|uniref:uncharacterized protein LOC126909712 n=1 Tax=Daktulosphaira vitifoliae TaxID=58002 RepID=UPI0021AA174D|nr:uncharacterized protein LOC126909712 [Daktulosphaira vitifoliae]